MQQVADDTEMWKEEFDRQVRSVQIRSGDEEANAVAKNLLDARKVELAKRVTPKGTDRRYQGNLVRKPPAKKVAAGASKRTEEPS